MSTIAGYFQINAGGQARLANPNEVNWRQQPEKNWVKKDTAMTERAAAYYPNPREAALERELLQQVSGKPNTPVAVNPKLSEGYSTWQSQLSRIAKLEAKLLEQIGGIKPV